MKSGLRFPRPLIPVMTVVTGVLFLLPVRAGAEDWAAKAEALWKDAANSGEVSVVGDGGEPRKLQVVGRVNFQDADAAKNVEIEAQMAPEYRNASGDVIKTDRKSMVDPIDNLAAEATGGAFTAVAPPIDHDAAGNSMGLKIADARNVKSSQYNRIGVRLPNTPAGRLLYVFEMADADGNDPKWFAREIESPLPGCPWRPTRASVEGPERRTHLRKMAVFLVEPWNDPAGRIPAKLKREDIKIDFDASSLSWAELKQWIQENISDATVDPAKPFVIQLPPGEISDGNRPTVVASPWDKWSAVILKLTEGRKVWLVGHPDTYIPSFAFTKMANLGILFCRFTRLGPDQFAATEGKLQEALVGYDGENLDFRNNWLECPDGVAFAGIQLRAVTNSTILDNIIATSGAGISTPGGTRVTSSVIARNWIERGHDAIQLYGSWVDAIVAYNHFAGATGSANREGDNLNLGANLHADEFQSQANQTERYPQTLYVFSNFAQFGRHNWPQMDAEIGGGTQNVIIDSDSYKDTHFYWNVFQNLAPGYRGFATIGPDQDWVQEHPERIQRDFIQNLTVMGNAFLDRLDFNNRPPNGYVRGLSSIAGRYNEPLFELINSENVYARTGLDQFPALFKGFVDGRPDAVLKSDWMKEAPSLMDVYERPIVYTGSHDTSYEPDFSKTAYANDKMLRGFVAPTDYTPKPEWTQSPAGAARLTPGSELAKIAPMPTDMAEFLGDSARKGSFFQEFSGPAVAAKPQTIPAPWRADAKDDGFLLHIKFGSVGKSGSRRELIRESDGKGLQYTVFLTERNTAAFELKSGDKLLSRIESTDTFEDGDHLSMQVYTPYFPVVPEFFFPMSVIARDHEEGLRKIRIVSSATPPSLPADTKEEVSIWMDPGRQFRFFRQEGGQWVPVASAEDSVYACAIRSIYAAMKAGGQEVKSSTKPTNANFQRDAYPLPEGRVFTIHLDGSDADSIESAKEFDLRWVRNDTGERSVRAMVSGKWVPSPDFNIMPMSTGRPRCFIRHNIDHQHKELDWLWTPDVALPRGEVTLFDGFDGTFEGFRVIRGGQGQYGQPQSYPIYRMLESVASAMSFIRTPLDSSGRVAGWGTPELWLHGGN